VRSECLDHLIVFNEANLRRVLSAYVTPLSIACPDSKVMSGSFPDPEALLPRAEVCRLCGGVSTMTIWRWRQDTALNFPAPTVISERCYWPRGEVIDWLKHQRASSAERARRRMFKRSDLGSVLASKRTQRNKCANSA
jgi:predicted DNA-binding transcriptional regulator AlpA